MSRPRPYRVCCSGRGPRASCGSRFSIWRRPRIITTQLIDGLGLRDAAVIETPAAGALTALAAPLGALLRQAELTAGSVVAIGWGRAIREVIRAGLPRIPGVLTVAATGGMQQQAAHFQINEFVRLAAEEFGGTPHFIHAPYLPSTELRDVFLGDAAIADSVALWDRTDVAIVGIGLPHAINPPEASAATLSEQALFHAAGDVLRHYFDADGTPDPVGRGEPDDRHVAGPASRRAAGDRRCRDAGEGERPSSAPSAPS